MMSELPSDRLQESPLFTYCGVGLLILLPSKITEKN